MSVIADGGSLYEKRKEISLISMIERYTDSNIFVTKNNKIYDIDSLVFVKSIDGVYYLKGYIEIEQGEQDISIYKSYNNLSITSKRLYEIDTSTKYLDFNRLKPYRQYKMFWKCSSDKKFSFTISLEDAFQKGNYSQRSGTRYKENTKPYQDYYWDVNYQDCIIEERNSCTKKDKTFRCINDFFLNKDLPFLSRKGYTKMKLIQNQKEFYKRWLS